MLGYSKSLLHPSFLGTYRRLAQKALEERGEQTTGQSLRGTAVMIRQ
jgi:hypothetical protein